MDKVHTVSMWDVALCENTDENGRTPAVKVQHPRPYSAVKHQCTYKLLFADSMECHQLQHSLFGWKQHACTCVIGHSIKCSILSSSVELPKELMLESAVKPDPATLVGSSGNTEPSLPEPCHSFWSEELMKAVADSLLLRRTSGRVFTDAPCSQAFSFPVLAELVDNSVPF